MDQDWNERLPAEESPPLLYLDESATLDPAPNTAARDRASLPNRSPLEREVAPPSRASGAMLGVIAMLTVLLAAGYLVPRLAEEIQYSLTRGRQRAEYEQAGQVLGTNTLGELSLVSQQVSLRIAPSVVIINVASSTPSEEPVLNDELLKRFGTPMPDSLGQGSGVVVGAEGYILTNHHVVRDAHEIRVTLSDGRRLPATRVGVDSLTDLALLKVDADHLVPADWGDSDKLPVGSLIWAVGSPFGLDRSLSFGILSAKNRGGVAGSPHQDFLQTDAAVNPGNSGGPLIDAAGRVVGINTAIVGQTYSGISFAIPSNVAREVAERLQSGGYVPRGWLGVELGSVSEQQAKAMGLMNTRGALIARVVEDGRFSPAQRAGMKAGDVVVRWDGLDVSEPAALSQFVAKTKIGTTVKVELIRGGQPTTLDVTVSERPQELN